MTKGIALHFGVNNVLTTAYPGMTPLGGPENDAIFMGRLSESLGYRGLSLDQPNELLESPTVRLGAAAKRGEILGLIQLASTRMQAGDILLISLAGHGSRRPSTRNPTSQERDRRDDYYCAFDGPVVDDDLRELWGKFPTDVRIVVVADACNTGTLIEVLSTIPVEAGDPCMGAAPVNVRGLTDEQRYGVALMYRDAFAQSAARVAKNPPQLKSEVLLLAACDENGVTYDDGTMGCFTKRLKSVWNGGAFTGTYEELIARTGEGMSGTFKPVWFPIGPKKGLECQSAFRI